VEGPVRIAKHGAGEKDHVGLAGGYEFVGLHRFSNHADCRGGDASFGADTSGKGNLKSGT
jgi:hypothetical protein